MTRLVLSLAALLATATAFLVGIGYLGTFLPLRAALEGFSAPAIGLLGSAYFGGFVIGCLVWPRGIGRVGHIRALTTALALISISVLAQSMIIQEFAWPALRLATGFAAAGVYMVVESWLNEETPNSSRGSVFTLYTALNYTALVAGQMLLLVVSPQADAAFALVAVFICLSIVPIALTRAAQPAPPGDVRLRLRRLFTLSPVGVIGCIAVGMANGTFWTLAPVTLRELGLGLDEIAILMAVTIAGGAVAQWPVGLLSDRVDRRLVLAATSLGAAMVSLFLAVTLRQAESGLLASPGLLYTAGVALGVTSLTGYALCIAHVNDRTPVGDFVSAAGGLLLLFGLGATTGPLLAGLLGAFMEAPATFFVMGIVSAILAAFAGARLFQRSTARRETDFVALPRTSPELFELDPRAEGDIGEPAENSQNPTR